jgi:phage terminase large subunit-like protein
LCWHPHLLGWYCKSPNTWLTCIMCPLWTVTTSRKSWPYYFLWRKVFNVTKTPLLTSLELNMSHQDLLVYQSQPPRHFHSQSTPWKSRRRSRWATCPVIFTEKGLSPLCLLEATRPDVTGVHD